VSAANVAAFERGVDALNRRDTEALLEVVDPEVEWHPAIQSRLAGDAIAFRGHDGVREMMRDFYETFGEIRFETSEVHEIADRVLGIGRLRVRGVGSGAETESPIAYLVEFRGGRVIRVRTYLDPDQARRAAGVTHPSGANGEAG
jgi:ketosteroid isomerase-like protein